MPCGFCQQVRKVVAAPVQQIMRVWSPSEYAAEAARRAKLLAATKTAANPKQAHSAPAERGNGGKP